MKNFVLGLAVLAFFAVGCDKDDETKSSQLSVGMTDAPIGLDSVNLVVSEISALIDNDWKVIYVGSQKINLLDYSNGRAKLFTENTAIDGDKIHEIRLKLTSAYVVKGTSKYVLEVPSGMTSGLKLKVKNGNIEPGIAYTVLIDLDAKRSFIKEKDKHFSYKMKPVLRAFMVSMTGKITGTLAGWTPLSNPSVYAIQGEDTLASAFPDVLGNFTLYYLDEGSYSIGVSDTLGNSLFYEGPFAVNKGQTTPAGTLIR